MSNSIYERDSSSNEDTKVVGVVNFFDDAIITTVTASAADVDEWIDEIYYIHRRRLRRLIVGLDVEWRPSFNRFIENPAAVLQLCVGRRCLIFQLIHADEFPASLVEFLGHSCFTFVGVGIQRDVEKLLLEYELDVYRFVDLRSLAADRMGREELGRAGLRALAIDVLDIDVQMPKRVTMSRWDREWLTWEQIQYACVDAFVSFEIGRLLNASTF